MGMHIVKTRHGKTALQINLPGLFIDIIEHVCRVTDSDEAARFNGHRLRPGLLFIAGVKATIAQHQISFVGTVTCMA